MNIKRRWFKLVLPCCWNWLWPNWFILVLVHDKQIHIYGERWLKLVLPFCSSTIWCWQLGWLWLVQSGPHFATLLHWLAQTGSYWLLCMTSKFIFMEEVFSLPPARNHQVHLKSFMADQAGLNMTDVKQKLIQRHVVRELPPLQRVLIQHNCECEECEGSWSWVQKAYSSNTNKTATNPASNRRIQHGKHQKESIGLHHSWYRFLADPIHSHAVPSPTPPPVAAAHMQGKKSLSLILTPNGYGCDQLKPVIPVCWNWLWLAQTGSSWFKLVFTGCECQEKMVQTGYELVLPCCWNWLWLAQTGCWNRFFLVQTGFH